MKAFNNLMEKRLEDMGFGGQMTEHGQKKYELLPIHMRSPDHQWGASQPVKVQPRMNFGKSTKKADIPPHLKKFYSKISK